LLPNFAAKFSQADDSHSYNKEGISFIVNTLSMQNIKNLKFYLTSWTIAGLLSASIQYSHVQLNNSCAKLKTENDLIVLPPTNIAKMFSLGYDQLIADFYWLGFIQYIGDFKARTQDNCKYAYNYLDLISTLDPKFAQPYWFAAFIVGAEMKEPSKADELINRGIQANKDMWEMPYIAGINQYLYNDNDINAAHYYRLAATYPGAPKFLSKQAILFDSKIPSFIKRINTYYNIMGTTKDPLVKEQVARKLIPMWLKVYKESPTERIRGVAKKELKSLGYDLDLK
jgi:hypothetical protein